MIITTPEPRPFADLHDLTDEEIANVVQGLMAADVEIEIDSRASLFFRLARLPDFRLDVSILRVIRVRYSDKAERAYRVSRANLSDSQRVALDTWAACNVPKLATAWRVAAEAEAAAAAARNKS